ncbi:unnamed protein product [Bemisia tabaci]|uniref:Sodium channel protein Nach n=1 Tax=Bemisia tabaci TaxID=7038 RepID=A0A9P0F238_BEMTA|nr:unnamed protein product [Bemisia tabaci]
MRLPTKFGEHHASFTRFKNAGRKVVLTRTFMKNRLRRKIEASRRTCHLVNEYMKYSTVHGVRYISHNKATVFERGFWLLMLMLCFAAACLIAEILFQRYRAIPSVLAVKDTHFPLYLFPFPTITICPANKVIKSRALEYLLRFVNGSTFDEELEESMSNIMSALALMQQPLYYRMNPYINASQHMFPLFETMNITDFMMTVLPTCRELFGRCVWSGQRIDCCEIFSIQRTEEGFCYSFNSLTSEDGRHCPLSEVLENEGVVEEDDIMYPGCQLRRNTAVGILTGLEVFLNKIPDEESLGKGQRDPHGVRVMVHTSYEYPRAGSGVWLQAVPSMRLSIMVQPSIIVTSDAVKRLSVATRQCVFPDERQLRFYHVYTEKSCLIQCRIDHVINKCNCTLYFFNLHEEVPECGLMDLPCVVKHTRHLKFLTPPRNVPGFDFTFLNESLDCSHCQTTCYETEHDLEVTFVPDSLPTAAMFYGYLDVAYGNLGATKYQRDITFTWIDLLVALGGVANLFLGFSLISVCEFLYWIFKILKPFITK